jgi:phospholipid/cholesterol/gamma-HCH transport system ATP-binding protein
MEASTLREAGAREREAADPVHIRVADVRFARGERPVFAGVSCDFPRGRINVILGGSGSGKTTLLRMFGGLLRPDSGSIRVDGGVELVGAPLSQIRELRRRVAMLFQGGALLDSMTVFDNAALPLREHTRLAPAEIRARVDQVFESVGLEGVDALLPAELSGGMRKRAALARALVMEPEILLCDEPFSGLDPATVRLIEALLVETNRRTGVTMIVASHHIDSTFRMADHIVLLVEGAAISGTPDEFRSSRDPRVEAFFAGERP